MIIAITYIKLKSFRGLYSFFNISKEIIKQAKKQKGCIKIKTYYKFPLYFYTITQWADQDKMNEFIFTGKHGDAIPKISKYSSVSRFLTYNDDSFPDLESAKEIIFSRKNVRVLKFK